jgi:hypothetical protein
VDGIKLISAAGSLLFLGFYSEIMGEVLELVQYFSNSVDQKIGNMASGESLAQKFLDMSNKQDLLHPQNGWTFIPNFFDWLTADISHLVIMLARTVTYCIREVSLMFLMAVGPLAIVISLFPGFEQGIGVWFKHFISVSFWGVTLGIIDRLFCAYLDNLALQDNTDGFIPLMICLTLMYCMAPMLTSKYIAHGASSVMSRVVGYASRSAKSTSTPVNMVMDKIAGNNNDRGPATAGMAGVASTGQAPATVTNPQATVATASYAGRNGAGNTIKGNSNTV